MTRAAVALLTLCVGASLAQEPITREARKKALLEGTHVLRRILHDHDCTPVESIADLAADPAKTVLIALGKLDVLAKVPGGLENFLADGGAVLLASDRAIEDDAVKRAVIKLAGVRIASDPVVSWNCYKGNTFCPFLVRPRGRLDPDLVDQVPAAVVTNVPSMLLDGVLPPGIRPLLFLSPAAEFDTATRGRAPIPGWPLFAVGGESRSGRLLVMADHSVFINEMMLPTDTGNVEFAYNVVRYLQEDGKRDRVLFLEDGRPQTTFNIPLKSPRLSPEELMSLVYSRRNELLVEAETWLARQEDDDNALERKLMDVMERNGLGWRNVLFGLVITATLLGVFVVAYRLGVRDRYGPDRSTPLLLQAAGKSLPSGPLAEQRIEALLATSDIRDPLRDLARRWLTDVGIAPRPPRRRPCRPSGPAVGGRGGRSARASAASGNWRRGRGRTGSRRGRWGGGSGNWTHCDRPTGGASGTRGPTDEGRSGERRAARPEPSAEGAARPHGGRGRPRRRRHGRRD